MKPTQLEHGCSVPPNAMDGIEVGGHEIGQAGIPVFLDGKDAMLDMFKLNESDPKKVIMAVGLNVAISVMRGYAKRHAPDLSAHFEKLQFPILFNRKGKSALRLAAKISRKEE